jgi:hypothetical protein
MTGPTAGAGADGRIRRELTGAIAACAGGAGLVLLAGSKPWTATTGGGPLDPVAEPVTGSSLLPWLAAVALVALAGAGALLATRANVRRILGGLLAMAGVGATAGTLAQLARLGADVRPLWPVVAAVGGLLVAGAGLLTVRRSRSWPAMGARYERPVRVRDPGRPVTDSEMWDALDRGDDPTAERPGR